MSTTQFPTKNAVARQWHVIDCEGKVLGKVASLTASMLMGKHKPNYTPFIDAGDHVILINAQKIVLTGKKEGQKVYRHFTGFPGGLVERTLQRVRSTRPQRMLEDAILGMLPKSKMGKQMYRKLNVYAGDKHPHLAQKPVAKEVNVKSVNSKELAKAS